MATEISLDKLQETVRGQVVKATSDLCLLEGVILPLIRQEKLWEHYPAECVNDFETPRARIYCRTPDVRAGRLTAVASFSGVSR